MGRPEVRSPAAEGSSGWALERTTRPGSMATAAAQATRAQAVEAWMHVARALAMSGDPGDRELAGASAAFVKEVPTSLTADPHRATPAVAPRSRPIGIAPYR